MKTYVDIDPSDVDSESASCWTWLDVLEDSAGSGVCMRVRYHRASNEVVVCRSKAISDADEEDVGRMIPLESVLEHMTEMPFVLGRDAPNKDVILDIRTDDVRDARTIAFDVTNLCFQYHASLPHQLNFILASFNEYCVVELCYYREFFDMYTWQIGTMSMGVPFGLFEHLEDTDVVIVHYDFLSEKMVEKLHKTGKDVIAWKDDDYDIRSSLQEYNADGVLNIIK